MAGEPERQGDERCEQSGPVAPHAAGAHEYQGRHRVQTRKADKEEDVERGEIVRARACGARREGMVESLRILQAVEHEADADCKVEERRRDGRRFLVFRSL